MRRMCSIVLPLVFCMLLGVALAGAGEPLYKGATAGNTQLSDNSMRYREFDDINLAMVLEPDRTLETSVRCTVQAKDGAKNRKGAKTTFDGELLDFLGNVIVDLPKRNEKTDKDGFGEIEFDLPPSLTLPPGPVVALMTVNPQGGKRVTELEVECDLRSRKPCEQGTTTLCLNDERFRVEVEWQDFDGSGKGSVIEFEEDQGLFFFFDPSNTELLIKMIDSCANNDHFWVFYAATTDVGFELTVTDTQTGSRKVYENPLGQPANAVTDTSAFATCP